MSLEKSKNPRDVIIAPVVSEKSYACMDRGQYTFVLQMEAIITHIILDFFIIFERRIQICENYFPHSTSRNMKRTRFEKHLFPKAKSRSQFCNFIKINIRRRI